MCECVCDIMLRMATNEFLKNSKESMGVLGFIGCLLHEGASVTFGLKPEVQLMGV